MRKYFNFIWLFISVFAMPVWGQLNFSASISGRVVNENGQPLRDSSVVYEYREDSQFKLCTFKEYYSIVRDDATFRIDEMCDRTDRIFRLFVDAAGPYPYGIFPIYAPYSDALKSSESRFAGIPVKLSGNKAVDLGDIKVQVRFYRVQLSVLNRIGEPYYKNRNDWAKFFCIIIRNRNGAFAGSKTLSISASETFPNIAKGSIPVALPDGTWRLELLKTIDDLDSKGRSHGILAKTTVTVNKSESNDPVQLIVNE
jgi:hypothetical protein